MHDEDANSLLETGNLSSPSDSAVVAAAAALTAAFASLSAGERAESLDALQLQEQQHDAHRDGT